MNELKIFENPEFGSVRTVEVNGNPYFVANDVARALGYAKPANAISAHCKGILKTGIPSERGVQETNVIPEGDIYRLVIKSQLPTAEKFEKWVMEEVLPSIRKHGAYMTPETLGAALLNPDTIIKIATALKDEQEKNRVLTQENKRMKPKEIFADAVAASHTSILIGDLAKLLKQNGIDIGQKRLFDWLRNNGYLIKRKGADWNMPTQRSMELGLFEVKESTINNPDGSVRINRTTKVTGKGQQYFINKFLNSAA